MCRLGLGVGIESWVVARRLLRLLGLSGSSIEHNVMTTGVGSMEHCEAGRWWIDLNLISTRVLESKRDEGQLCIYCIFFNFPVMFLLFSVFLKKNPGFFLFLFYYFFPVISLSFFQ